VNREKYLGTAKITNTKVKSPDLQGLEVWLKYLDVYLESMKP
jgi:hypothetical protein